MSQQHLSTAASVDPASAGELANAGSIVVRGRGLDVSARFREHVAEKLARVDRFGIPLSRIDVEVSAQRNPRQSGRAVEVELTCRGHGPVIRAEASAADKYAALDVAYTRLEERLRRAGDRRRFSRHGRGATLSAAEVADVVAGSSTSARPADAPVDRRVDGSEPEDRWADPADPSVVYEDGPVVVREKLHSAAPMSVEQALDAMELVGHDFFLFADSESGRPSVVYRRRGFDYGLIRLDTASADG